ncbi:MAG: methyltransferase domain-containing protein [Burkholderiales bacterium]|nr:methyltransferase domain-containing protein [Burkholderiales bacterium]
MSRTIEPEWLDELPPDDPRAMRSRRDLDRINALMMNAGLVARELRRAFPGPAPRSIAEIGAGDGRFLLGIARKLTPRWGELDVVLLDQQKLVSHETRRDFITLGWRAQPVTEDVFAWLAQSDGPAFDVIIANLFLHHFDNAKLAELLSLIARRTRTLIACEPQRSVRALLFSRMLGVIGCNDVTRHDAVVSVRAGFKDEELSGLWTAGDGWTLQERTYGLFSHYFVATRDNSDSHSDTGAR